MPAFSFSNPGADLGAGGGVSRMERSGNMKTRVRKQAPRASGFNGRIPRQVSIPAHLSEDLQNITATCPYCGAVVQTGFDNKGRIKWWENTGETCPHFRGFYQGYGQVVAFFQRW